MRFVWESGFKGAGDGAGGVAPMPVGRPTKGPLDKRGLESCKNSQQPVLILYAKCRIKYLIDPKRV